MTTPITKTIPTRDRWVDKTTQYPVALTQQTFRTNLILIGCFLVSLFSFTLVIPMCLLAAFFAVRLLLNYRQFKQHLDAPHHFPLKAIKRLIPVYSLGFMALLLATFLLCLGAMVFHPLGEMAAALMMLTGAWGFLGLFIGMFVYPEFYSKAQPSFFDEEDDMMDPSNPHGFTHPGSPIYIHRSHETLSSRH